MADTSSLASFASIFAAFGAAMLFFRIQRELKMEESGEINWIPWADWLLVSATVLSLLFVVLPLAILPSRSALAAVPYAAVAASAVLVVGYIPAILAHYRFIFSDEDGGESKPRTNPEPSERIIVIAVVVLALTAGGAALWRRLGTAIG